MVDSSNFLTETVTFVRDDLVSNITDPISGTRAANERFVMTSYPKRAVRYPIITVRGIFSDIRRLGMQSEQHQVRIPVEVRIWARNVVERDSLAQQVFNRMRQNQFGAGSTSSFMELHDFTLLSTVDVDEPIGEEGEQSIKSKVMEIEYFTIVG